MKRLTEVDNKGNWRIAGVEWGNVKGNLYGALRKLKDYEDTGLTPAEVMDGKLLTGWIPVEERLPESNNNYLVTRKTDCIICQDIDHYNGDGKWTDDRKVSKVIAWMPLPEPYKPQSLAHTDNDTAQSGLQTDT